LRNRKSNSASCCYCFVVVVVQYYDQILSVCVELGAAEEGEYVVSLMKELNLQPSDPHHQRLFNRQLFINWLNAQQHKTKEGNIFEPSKREKQEATDAAWLKKRRKKRTAISQQGEEEERLWTPSLTEQRQQQRVDLRHRTIQKIKQQELL